MKVAGGGSRERAHRFRPGGAEPNRAQHEVKSLEEREVKRGSDPDICRRLRILAGIKPLETG